MNMCVSFQSMTKNRGDDCDFIQYYYYFPYLRIFTRKAPFLAVRGREMTKREPEGPPLVSSRAAGETGSITFRAREWLSAGASAALTQEGRAGRVPPRRRKEVTAKLASYGRYFQKSESLNHNTGPICQRQFAPDKVSREGRLYSRMWQWRLWWSRLREGLSGFRHWEGRGKVLGDNGERLVTVWGHFCLLTSTDRNSVSTLPQRPGHRGTIFFFFLLYSDF